MCMPISGSSELGSCVYSRVFPGMYVSSIATARPELIVVLLGQCTVGLEENAIDVTTKVNLTCQYEEEELVDNVNTE